MGYKGLDKRGLNGLNIQGFDGLSIVRLRPLSSNLQIVISIYRFVDNCRYAGYEGLVTMKARIVKHYKAGELKDIPNTYIQTILSGYKGLKDMKVWQYMLDIKV